MRGLAFAFTVFWLLGAAPVAAAEPCGSSGAPAAAVEADPVDSMAKVEAEIDKKRLEVATYRDGASMSAGQDKGYMPGTDCGRKLRIASWNLANLYHLSGHDLPGREGTQRSDEDYDHLQRFARLLDADLVALQEVNSIAAIRRVFPEEKWQAFISDRKRDDDETGRATDGIYTGFVVRNGIEVKRYSVACQPCWKSLTCSASTEARSSGCTRLRQKSAFFRYLSGQ